MHCSLAESIFLVAIGLLNFVLLLLSVALLAFGAIALWSLETLFPWFVSELTPEQWSLFEAYLLTYHSPIGITFLTVGVTVLVIISFGFFGVCCKNSGMMTTYCILIALATMGVVTFAAIYGADPSMFRGSLDTSLTDMMADHFDDPDNPARKGNFSGIDPLAYSFIALMRYSPCCGITHYTDFQSSKAWNTNYTYVNASGFVDEVIGAKVPVMCCQYKVAREAGDGTYYAEPTDTDCLRSPTIENAYLHKGCLTYYQDASYGWILGTLSALSATLALSLLLSIAFLGVAKNSKQSSHNIQDMEPMVQCKTYVNYGSA